jgi:hypothetical protein
LSLFLPLAIVNLPIHCLIVLAHRGCGSAAGGRASELARVDDRPLQPLDGWREGPDRKRMLIRSPDGAARSVRAIKLF